MTAHVTAHRFILGIISVFIIVSLLYVMVLFFFVCTVEN